MNTKATQTATSRPSVADRPIGLKALIPTSTKGRVIAALCGLVVLFIIIDSMFVIADSISDENYYENPAHELAADFVDATANKLCAITPNAADPAIDAVRESLTGRSKWTNDVIDAETYWGVNIQRTKFIVAMIKVESNEDENVDWQGNVMEVDPGAGQAWDVLCSGVPERGVQGNTPQASIYAGVMITRDCVNSFEDHLRWSPDPFGLNDAALLSQGYNYGYEGWFGWCERNQITTWTLEASSSYQSMMGGIGTANHGQKVADTLKELL